MLGRQREQLEETTGGLRIQLANVRFLGTLPKKNTGKWGNFEKTGGGGLPESHFHVFTVFNMGDLPKINGKIGKKFPNRGEGAP